MNENRSKMFFCRALGIALLSHLWLDHLHTIEIILLVHRVVNSTTACNHIDAEPCLTIIILVGMDGMKFGGIVSTGIRC